MTLTLTSTLAQYLSRRLVGSPLLPKSANEKREEVLKCRNKSPLRGHVVILLLKQENISYPPYYVTNV